ncbi:MAG TPA: GAF domain-containing protein, partial [Desulfosarcina sp.]|nr:GAF domain-containing protein [Desulfosarcina sp.]
GLAAVQGDRVLILNDGHMSSANCLFTNSSHLPLDDLKHSVWLQAVEHKQILRIPDLSKEPNLCPAEQEAVAHGVRSMLIAPLFFRGEAIGTFWVKSKQPNGLRAVDTEKMRHIAPLFSMALKRGLDDMNNEVQAVIKEKCTAVHPSVEWRFREAAMDHMERLREGRPSEMEPIIFKAVIPLFGQSDIRGSSEARVQSIQSDLTEQLNLAGAVMRRAAEAKSWPLIDEFIHRIERRVAAIKSGLSTEEESAVALFLQQEVAPSFSELRTIGPRVSHAIDAYHQALDPALGVVYRRRQDFEESVSKLNERLSGYLDRQQNEAQRIFPHYFEKHQTDGIDYVIYMGASMHPEGRNNPFYLSNLSLWQFQVACGLAWHTQDIRSELKVPLDTCHLILVNHTPLAIRFRYDEKRFDVDGAYDVRHEIIKSRLDKAVVKGGRERLTQPGRIAVVYSHPREGRDVRRHIDYLQSRGHLLDDLEFVDLEDLPGVRGLKALRVGVNLEAATAAESLRRIAG